MILYQPSMCKVKFEGGNKWMLMVLVLIFLALKRERGGGI